MSRIMRDAAHVGGSRCCRQTALLKVMPDRVIVADIGSVSRPFKFAWAAVDLSHPEPVGCGDDPGNCVDALLDAIGSESRVALLLEAPMAVPVPSAETGWSGLGRARAGEGNRAWSAGAGTGALATGLAQDADVLAVQEVEDVTT